MLLTVKLRCAGSELQVVGPAYSNSNIHSVWSRDHAGLETENCGLGLGLVQLFSFLHNFFRVMATK